MKKINTKEVEEYSWTSPKGKFGGMGRDLSEALGWIRRREPGILLPSRSCASRPAKRAIPE